MTTPDQLARKFNVLAADLGGRIPVAGLAASAAVTKGFLVAGANRGKPPGGSQIGIKRPRGTGPTASVAVVGWGFAVLAEHGSYKHPGGWAIYPRKSGAAQARSRAKTTKGLDRRALAAARRLGYSRAMLGDPSTGFAAAYVTNHPPIPARPYQHAAAAAASKPAGAAYDKLVLASLAAVF